MLHLISVVQKLFYISVFTSLKSNRKHSNPDVPISPSHQSCFTSELRVYIYKEHLPEEVIPFHLRPLLKIPTSVKRRPSGMTLRQPNDATILLACARRMRWTLRKSSEKEAALFDPTEAHKTSKIALESHLHSRTAPKKNHYRTERLLTTSEEIPDRACISPLVAASCDGF